MLYGHRRFIIHIKIRDVYENIANNVKKLFDISNYAITRPLPTAKSKGAVTLNNIYNSKYWASTCASTCASTYTIPCTSFSF